MFIGEERIGRILEGLFLWDALMPGTSHTSAQENRLEYIPNILYYQHKYAFDSYTNSPFSTFIIYESAMLLGHGTS